MPETLRVREYDRGYMRVVQQRTKRSAGDYMVRAAQASPLQPQFTRMYKKGHAPHTFSEVREFIKDTRPKTTHDIFIVVSEKKAEEKTKTRGTHTHDRARGGGRHVRECVERELRPPPVRPSSRLDA